MRSFKRATIANGLRKCWGSCCISVAMIALLAAGINCGAYQLSVLTGQIGEGRFSDALASFWVYLGLQLCVPIFELLCNLAQNRAQRSFSLYFRNELSEKTMQFSLKDHGSHDRKYFLNGSINGIELFDQQFVENLFNCIYFVLLLIGGLFMLSRLYPALGLAMLGAILLSSLCAHLYDKAIERLTDAYLDQEKKYLNSIIDIVDGFLDIYFSRCRTFFCRAARRRVKENQQAGIKYNTSLTALGIGFYLPMFIVDMAILGLILHGILANDIGLDVLVAYLSICGLLLNSSESLFAGIVELKSGIDALPWDILAYQKESPASAKTRDTDHVLEVEGLSFSFNEHTHIAVPHFQLHPGEKILLRGASGSGKSTFLKLLTRQLGPSQGAIFVNGQNIESITEEELYARIGYLPQNGGLFQGTLRENILFDDQASDSLYDEVIARSMLTDFVEQHGSDYRISPGGANVSGGERQRILLARLFAQNKKILLMDEPFVNIPQSLGRKIEDSFIFEEDVSVILISHDAAASYRQEYKVVEIDR